MTMPDLVSLLSRLLATSAESISGAALSPDEASLLKDRGFLVEQGLATTIWCENCDEGHPADVVRHPVSGAPAIRCPEIGYEELSPDRLRAYSIDKKAIAVAIAGALAIPSRMVEEVFADSLWRLGFAKGDTMTVEVFLLTEPAHTAMKSEATLSELRERASKRKLLLHPSSLSPVYSVDSMRSCSIENIFGLSDELEIDPDHLEDIFQALWPAPTTQPLGRPSGKAATIEVIEHLKKIGRLPEGSRPGARAIKAVWSEVLLDLACPPESTIRGHLAEAKKEGNI